MYIYTLKVSLTKQTSPLKFTEVEEILYDAAATYNSKSTVAANPKSLKIDRITDDIIYITLRSSQPLRVLGKALRSFSVELLKHAEFYNEISSNGQLLHTVCTSEKITEDSEDTIPNSGISDLDFVKGLLDYLYKKRDPNTTVYRRKIAAMEKMKQIAIEAEIIKK